MVSFTLYPVIEINSYNTPDKETFLAFCLKTEGELVSGTLCPVLNWMLDKDQKPNSVYWNRQKSEQFRVDLNILLLCYEKIIENSKTDIFYNK
jgi:hypothetical protein